MENKIIRYVILGILFIAYSPTVHGSDEKAVIETSEFVSGIDSTNEHISTQLNKIEEDLTGLKKSANSNNQFWERWINWVISITLVVLIILVLAVLLAVRSLSERIKSGLMGIDRRIGLLRSEQSPPDSGVSFDLTGRIEKYERLLVQLHTSIKQLTDSVDAVQQELKKTASPVLNDSEPVIEKPIVQYPVRKGVDGLLGKTTGDGNMFYIQTDGQSYHLFVNQNHLSRKPELQLEIKFRDYFKVTLASGSDHSSYKLVKPARIIWDESQESGELAEMGEITK